MRFIAILWLLRDNERLVSNIAQFVPITMFGLQYERGSIRSNYNVWLTI